MGDEKVEETKEKKKMKLWKKTLIIIGIILIILLLIIFVRYQILTDIQQKNSESNLSKNCNYISKSDNTLIEYWRKDGIMKMNLKQINGIGDITFWKNTESGEALIFWNSPEKTYSVDKGGMIPSLPNSMIYITDNMARLSISANPMLYIGNKKYENKNCYNIKIDTNEEIIEKDTGLVLYSSNGGKRTVKYDFNNVTDNDIEKPDTTQYKYID